ncbi:MAG: L-threonylcarbamoyladenylate synthase [Cyanobacteria bacterium M_DeepCast_100m_m1_067]|nr:L-threonylcarbamoyladenylate synthase [Cyanobacteria bacterium K_DeepCast_0m_m1_088]MBM5814262.1 L-threonylcarbamoyladenylate synthase [Cyanobacteria bacterium M_DeepCast_100m_m1_067]
MTSLRCSPHELAARLLAGEAALFPTDTLPALASRPEAANLLWELKQRPRHKPVILMAANSEALLHCLGRPIEAAWQAMANRYWPGALTLVLPAQGPWLEQLNPGGNSLGLRLPACPAALELLALSGPLATTSANRSGEPACLDHHEAEARFPQVAQLGPVPWPAPSGQGSTVIEWLPAGGWKLLRAGAVMPPELSANGASA